MAKEDEIQLVPYQIVSVTLEKEEIPRGVRMIEAPAYWLESDLGKGAVVAILDTGIATKHPDLEDRILGGRNFTNDYVGDPTNFEDNNGHGTHVAGIIAANLNEHGIVGVAPQAKLLICKVLNEIGGGSYDSIIKAIHYCCDWIGPNGEKVSAINMSLGGPLNVPELEEAVKKAVHDCRIPIVCAAGNEGDNDYYTFEYDYPASYNEVISVGAVNYDLILASFSNVNEEIDLVAPGVDITSTYLNNEYAILSGTSMAAPHVAGALALLKVQSERDFGRSLTEAELYAQLIKRTVPIDFSKQAVGNGFIQLKYMDKYRELVSFIRTTFNEVDF